MKVLVDTSVWSLALRRRIRSGKEIETGEGRELGRLIADANVAIIGAIRQELLSGIREPAQFERVRTKLSAFRDLSVESADYETAASYFNRCRTRGIQGSNTDYLICAVAARERIPILTTDADFSSFKKILPIVLHQYPSAGVMFVRPGSGQRGNNE